MCNPYFEPHFRLLDRNFPIRTGPTLLVCEQLSYSIWFYAPVYSVSPKASPKALVSCGQSESYCRKVTVRRQPPKFCLLQLLLYNKTPIHIHPRDRHSKCNFPSPMPVAVFVPILIRARLVPVSATSHKSASS